MRKGYGTKTPSVQRPAVGSHLAGTLARTVWTQCVHDQITKVDAGTPVHSLVFKTSSGPTMGPPENWPAFPLPKGETTACELEPNSPLFLSESAKEG